MYIALMPHIPYNLIPWAIKYPVQGYGEFDYTKIRSEMASVGSNGRYQFLSNLAC